MKNIKTRISKSVIIFIYYLPSIKKKKNKLRNYLESRKQNDNKYFCFFFVFENQII